MPGDSIGGDVHTIRISTSQVASFADLLDALQSGCQTSGAPELRGLDMEAAEVQYLASSNGKPALVTSATSVNSLRSAKAFRLLFTEQDAEGE